MIFAGGQMVQDGIIFDADVVGPWVYERAGTGRYLSGSASAIARIRDGHIIAGVLYERFNGASVVCSIASDGKGWLDRRFLSMMFDYPFNKIKVRRLTGFVVSTNLAARRFDEHLGFELEAILQDAHPDGDICVYKMTADKCRWLKDLPYARVATQHS